MVAIEKVTGSHALFTGKLKLKELKELAIKTSDIERFTLDEDLPWRKVRNTPRLGRLIDLKDRLLPIRRGQCRPGPWNRTQPPNKVIDLLRRLLPVNLASLLKKLGGGL